MRVALQARGCTRFALPTRGHIMEARKGDESPSQIHAPSAAATLRHEMASVMRKRQNSLRKHSVVGSHNLVHADQILLREHLH